MFPESNLCRFRGHDLRQHLYLRCDLRSVLDLQRRPYLLRLSDVLGFSDLFREHLLSDLWWKQHVH